jgi:DNA-binding response OmpR family regulator
MRILIVEDELALGNLLKAKLKAEAYAVDLECDGERGLSLALANRYDVIILGDIVSGRKSYEICRELRRVGQVTPILFISVQAGVDKKVRSLDEGADDYLAKPFSYSEMKARLRALLRRPRSIQSQSLHVADLILDADSAGAIRNGRRIYLTMREFSLLQYLMRNVGQLVTRAMILEHVWDDEVNPLSNMIETHIHNLRGKIDEPGAKKLIHTLSGRGYILMDKE